MLSRRRGVIGLMKFNHKKNLLTESQRRRRRTSCRALLQLPRLARPEGCYVAYDYWSCAGQIVRFYGPDLLGTS
jgi:hypothetical protein